MDRHSNNLHNAIPWWFGIDIAMLRRMLFIPMPAAYQENENMNIPARRKLEYRQNNINNHNNRTVEEVD